MKKCLLAALTLSILLTGCTGPFVLTHKVQSLQTSFDNKWVDEVAFLGCVIFPVYKFAILADAIVFNSVEFWTGENPMDSVNNQTGSEMCLRTVAAQL